MLHNTQAQTTPFALSYGVMAQYGVTSRLNLTMEFGGKTTFSGFDGIGNANSFGGDNILYISAGSHSHSDRMASARSSMRNL